MLVFWLFERQSVYTRGVWFGGAEKLALSCIVNVSERRMHRGTQDRMIGPKLGRGFGCASVLIGVRVGCCGVMRSSCRSGGVRGYGVVG